MKKDNKKTVAPSKCGFFKLDRRKPIAAEGYKSILPWVLMFISLFFWAVLAFIIYVNKDNGADTSGQYTVFYAICGTFSGAALIIFVGYHTRNILVRKRILNADVTYATLTEITVTKHTSRDKDGDLRTREEVLLIFQFYDRSGNIRTEKFKKIYSSAPTFYEGQQIVVAFDESKCFILSKYTLLDEEGNEAAVTADTPNTLGLNGCTVEIDVSQYTPLGYDKRFFILSGIYFAFSLVFAFMLTYFAITVKDAYVWVFASVSGAFFIMFLALSLSTAYVPFKTKRCFDSVTSIGATYTSGKLAYTSKVYGNGAEGKYYCFYLDTDGNEQKFKISAFAAKKLVRQGDTDVIVAYAQDKAVALVKKSVVVY